MREILEQEQLEMGDAERQNPRETWVTGELRDAEIGLWRHTVSE